MKLVVRVVKENAAKPTQICVTPGRSPMLTSFEVGNWVSNMYTGGINVMARRITETVMNVNANTPVVLEGDNVVN